MVGPNIVSLPIDFGTLGFVQNLDLYFFWLFRSRTTLSACYKSDGGEPTSLEHGMQESYRWFLHLPHREDWWRMNLETHPTIRNPTEISKKKLFRSRITLSARYKSDGGEPASLERGMRCRKAIDGAFTYHTRRIGGV